jgi:hypothetical protein
MTTYEEAVEKAARALASVAPGESWPTNEELGGHPVLGTRDDEYHAAMLEQARDALAAAGFPELLAENESLRVEAEDANAGYRAVVDHLSELAAENKRLRAERDEFKRLFGECHPVHLDGVQRARVAESQRDAEKARADGLADALRETLAVHAPVAALNVRSGKLQQVCSGCGTDDGNWQIWPCPSARILTAALHGAATRDATGS